jgi:hypothetical protein
MDYFGKGEFLWRVFQGRIYMRGGEEFHEII